MPYTTSLLGLDFQSVEKLGTHNQSTYHRLCVLTPYKNNDTKHYPCNGRRDILGMVCSEVWPMGHCRGAAFQAWRESGPVFPRPSSAALQSAALCQLPVESPMAVSLSPL